jgi:TP901 family phage tail tape measure protein
MARRGAKLGTSVLDLDVDDSRFHSKLSGARIAAEKWTSQAGASLTNVGRALTGVGQAWSRNVTLPILAAGAATGKMALDFDTSLRQISGLTDVTADELDGIREKVLALGPAVGKGPQELVEAFYFIASAGFKADEAMEVLETSARAAAAGLGETQTIAQVLGGVINAYGRENITAARAADILTEAVSQGTAEASGLASVIGNVVPGAAALGVSFDQVTAAMAGMTLTGVGVEESATSLIQIFSSLQKPTVQAEEALKGLGLSSEQLRRQLREQGLLATLRTLEERFAGNETAAAAVFGNIRALRGVTALLTLDSEQLNAVFGKVADSAGRLATAYEETEGPQREIDRAMADIQATAIELGADVLPMLVEVMRQLAAGARSLGVWWRSLDDGTKQLVVQALALMAVAGPLLLIVGKLTTGVGLLFKGLSLLTKPGGIPALVKGLGKAGLVGVAIAAAVAVGELQKAASDFFYELVHGKKALTDFRKLVDVVGNDFKAAVIDEALRSWGVSIERFTEIVEAAGGDVDAAFQAMRDASGDTAVALGELRAAGGELADDTSFEEWDRRAQRAMRGVTERADEVPGELAATLVDGQYVVGPAAEVMVDPIAEALAKAKEEAGKKAREIFDALATGLVGSPGELEEQVAAFVENVTHPYSDLKRRADIEAVLASKAVRDGLRSTDSQVKADTVALVENLISQYESLEPGALAAGELVNPALQAGIDRNLQGLLDYVNRDVVEPVTSRFDLAEELDAAGFKGLSAYAAGAERARIQKVAVAIAKVQAEAREKLGRGYFSEGLNVVDTYSKGIQYGADRLLASRASANVAKQVRDMLRIYSEPRDPSSPLRGITTWGPNIVETISGGMLTALGDAHAAADAVGQTMADALRSLPEVAMPLSPALAGLDGMAGGAGAAAGGIVNNGDLTQQWILNVEGQPRVAESKREALDELERMSTTWG